MFETKSNRNDLVTAVDKRIEAYISEELVAATGYPLLGGGRPFCQLICGAGVGA